MRYSIFRYRLTKHVFMGPKNGKRAPGMPLLGLQQGEENLKTPTDVPSILCEMTCVLKVYL